MSLRPKVPTDPIVYPLAMSRLALLMAATLALAACSGSDASTSTLETSPPPQPTVTAGPTTTSTAPTTSTTTTTTTPTTTEPETTTTFLEVVTPATTEPEPPISVEGNQDAIFAAAFAGYQTAYDARRSAIRNPSNPELRQRLDEVYVPGEAHDRAVRFLDSLLDTTERSFADPVVPNSLTLIAGVAANEQFAQLSICEVLTEDVVDVSTGATVYSDPAAYILQVSMVLDQGLWKVKSESYDQEFLGASSCVT